MSKSAFGEKYGVLGEPFWGGISNIANQSGNTTILALAMKKAAAVVLKKCPKCHEGNMFVSPIIPKIHKFNKMNETCPKCGQSFHPELGFYFGAMYFTYAFNIALLIGIFVASQVLGDPNLVQTLLLVVIPTVLLVPFNFRLSRAMMLHLFGGIRYDSEAAERQKAGK